MKFGIGIYFDGRKVLSYVSTLYLNPRGQGALSRVWGCTCSLNHSTRQEVYSTKVVGKVSFSGGGSNFSVHNPDLEVPGPHVLLSCSQSFPGGVYKTKVVVCLPSGQRGQVLTSQAEP